MGNMLKILIYGWYGRSIKNIGDLLFCDAFRKLFPNSKLTFVQELKKEDLFNHDVLIFGGGSFLYAPINNNCNNELLNILKDKKIFYIGVGTETEIHPMHQDVMKIAKLVATRTIGDSNKLKQITSSKIIEIPDLAYLLQNENITITKNDNINSVLILTNSELLPRWDDIHWKHASWNYFKSEFSQFLDILKEKKYKLKFFPMCQNHNKHDSAASIEIMNMMKIKNYDELIWDHSVNYDQVIELISKYDIVVSQRYHGAILAHMCSKPCLVIAHHDKLKNPTNSSISVSYYELSKQKLYDNFILSKNIKILPIKLNTFEDIRVHVYSCLE